MGRDKFARGRDWRDPSRWGQKVIGERGHGTGWEGTGRNGIRWVGTEGDKTGREKIQLHGKRRMDKGSKREDKKSNNGTRKDGETVWEMPDRL
jgi:hypothetical protein